jgi:hypothetical protein
LFRKQHLQKFITKIDNCTASSVLITGVLDTTPVAKASPAFNQSPWLRIGCLLGLCAVAFAFLAVHATHHAVAGSYTAYLLVTPVLGALIASGIRPSPGVADTEFDWIVAIIFAAAGLLALRMLSQRLPALSGLWNWQHYTPVIFVMAAGMILFGVRHVLRLWRSWVFALCCAPAMPFLLATSHLGGTEDDAVLVGAGLGTIAVYLATSTFARWRRLLAAAVNLAVALGLDYVLGWEGLLARTVLVAGAVPVLNVVAIRVAGHIRVAKSLAAHPAKGTAKFPHVGIRGAAVLVVLAAAMLISSPPVSSEYPEVAADRGWIAQLNLRPVHNFTFISRFLGPGATLTRYTMDGNPAVAVDVISSPNLALLNDYADTVWYPSSTPVNFQSVDLGEPIIAKSAQSDPDSAAANPSDQWYALTWLWRTTGDFQRVTVVVSQDLANGTPPPPAGPISWTNSLLQPMLWLTRQQPAPIGVIPKQVSRTATIVAEQILAAGVSG